jgi:hypothetical protein
MMRKAERNRQAIRLFQKTDTVFFRDFMVLSPLGEGFEPQIEGI